MSRMKELEDENRCLEIRDTAWCIDSYAFIFFQLFKVNKVICF